MRRKPRKRDNLSDNRKINRINQKSIKRAWNASSRRWMSTAGEEVGFAHTNRSKLS